RTLRRAADTDPGERSNVQRCAIPDECWLIAGRYPRAAGADTRSCRLARSSRCGNVEHVEQAADLERGLGSRGHRVRGRCFAERVMAPAAAMTARAQATLEI